MNDIFSLAEGMHLQGGKYTIVRMLSHGGFGVTYLAHHNLLDVDVCIKEFFPSLWCNRDAFSYEVSVSTTGNVDMVDRFMQKFIKEAQSIARLHHEGIVKFHDVFEENGTAYYVMDFIEGQTLQQMVKDRGALPLSEAIGYIRQAAEALGYLHGKRMNHLDVKPANMMIDRSGKLTLIDFGVAKHYGEDGHQTTTTPMCISRGYSPIEQYKDGGVSQFSPAADIYPLGATLYYLLTGTVPPEATELAVDELVIPDTIPTHIAEAIRHAMESKPSRRTPSAAAFVDELGGKDGKDNIATEPVPVHRSIQPVSKPRPRHEGSISSAESGGAPKKASPTVEKDEVKAKNITRIIVTIIIVPLLFIIIYGITHFGTLNKNQSYADTEASQQNNEFGHSQANTGDLLAYKNGEYIYFTPYEWSKVAAKSSYKKLGVVVNDGSCNPFYVVLGDNDSGDRMTWDEAVSRFGEDILPSEEQCRAMAHNKDGINKAIDAFGGTKMRDWYWGKGYDSSLAFGVAMTSGDVSDFGKDSKAYTFRVRPVAPLP